ncbi:unnamed protein product [Protopolystoma xenopodis]|uniref:Uncharacterized protein n=1 Tax=Protopolystoma xenopodis TaxID=117903 RepID=A0A448WKP3_9PLAT|nr:unnamed protein product [Protopolystoma xenopodis]
MLSSLPLGGSFVYAPTGQSRLHPSNKYIFRYYAQSSLRQSLLGLNNSPFLFPRQGICHATKSPGPINCRVEQTSQKRKSGLEKI